jgi:hypothetical protein
MSVEEEARSEMDSSLDAPPPRRSWFRVPYEGKKKPRSLLAAAAPPAPPPSERGAADGAPRRPWARGAFRREAARPMAHGLVVSLAVHGGLGAFAIAGGLGLGTLPATSAKNASALTVEVELPKIAPPPPIAVPAAVPPSKGLAAAPLGEVEGPVLKGRKSRQGRDAIQDAARVGVLGAIGNFEGRGHRAARERGGTAGPDQSSPYPFAGIAGLRDTPGSYLPVGGSGGSGSGTDEGGGSGGGRGIGHAKGLLTSYGDGTGDQIVLERRGSASGVEGGIGTGSGGGGCRDEEAIARVVNSHKGRLRHCYNTALQGDRNLSGDVSVRFVIAESGAVSAAQIVGANVADAALNACLLESVRGWSFGEQVGCETVVRYTFSLTRSF